MNKYIIVFYAVLKLFIKKKSVLLGKQQGYGLKWNGEIVSVGEIL